jgi:CelD/BcsL family acetyltransferase involved in cellulose biosynthesis
MVEIADTSRSRSAPAAADAGDAVLMRLRDVARSAWIELATDAVEPNGYYLPGWALAVDAGARNRTDVDALCGWDSSRQLAALMPVVSAWRAFRLPLPVLVAAESYGTLRTPLLLREDAAVSARLLIDEAIAKGAHAIILRDVPLDGAALSAIRQALARDHLTPTVLHGYSRAFLDATGDADALLRDALGAKKLKELRRQRHRLGEAGELAFKVAKTPDDVASAIEMFLTLEASGWKGKRGTALAQHEGDIAFIRRATVDLAATGQCEIALLAAGATPIAAGIILKHGDRAFWFKLGIDERFAKLSPGVQLAIELTRYFCADASVRFVDSTAPAGSPMINPIWRGRFLIGDVLIPLRPGDLWTPVIQIALRAHRFVDTTARGILHAMRRLKARLG